MKEILDNATKMVIVIKHRLVHSRMFKNLSENLDNLHINLMLHTEIQCLSRGRVYNRVFELKGELQDYFQENSRPDLESVLKVKSGWRNKPT
jgi:hypothetical protein